MKISTEIIRKFNPCVSRFNVYLEHYEGFEGSFDEFIDLPLISYSDKVWVAKHVLNKNQLVHFGLLCAESVLGIFEAKNPEDKRVRNCIEFLKTIENFSDMTEQQRSEVRQQRSNAYDAAAAACAAAACAAAYDAAAACAAAYADVAAAAAYAYAAADADAAAYADAARETQQTLNLQFLKMAASL